MTLDHLMNTGSANPVLLRRLESVHERFHVHSSNREVFDTMRAARPWVKDGTEIAGWLDAALADLTDRLHNRRPTRLMIFDDWQPPKTDC
jgi:hypothetical protein